jgi:TrbL/VirB6 plasmid conjugal transfer protein
MPIDMGWIQTPLDALYASYAGLFIAESQEVLWSLAGILLIMYAFRYGKTGGILWFIFDYGITILVAANILAYWATPSPLLGGYSVSGFFPAVGEFYANQIGSKQLDILFQQTGAVVAAVNTQHVGMADLAMIPVSWGVQLLMWIVDAVAFVSVAISYLMIGILRLIGPIFVPWMIFPRTAWLFWNMLSSLLQYSFFRVVAAALVFVIGTSMTLFISNVIHGDYSLAHLSVLMGKMIVISVLSVFMALRAERMTADLFHGGSSAGSGILGSAVATAGAVVKAA